MADQQQEQQKDQQVAQAAGGNDPQQELEKKLQQLSEKETDELVSSFRVRCVDFLIYQYYKNIILII